ncbi:MAG: DNA primase [Deltaproteobacteria bacterium]|nr:DNA primase [Deltaproteobacteria bacterium]
MGDSIPAEKITEIKERASIVEVVSDFVSLKKSGKNYLGLCPFHSERTPSFTVNEEKGIFHCFGCGAGGTIFNFLMRASHLSFPEAVREVAKRYGILIPRRELSEEEKRRRSLKARLFEINEMAAEYYHQLLGSPKEGEEGRKYLAKRGISEETIREHRLGFAPPSWDSLALFLRNKEVPLKLAEGLGLIIARKEGTAPGGRPSFYDRFRHRVIFPIINEAGRVSGFGGRIIDDSAADGNQASPKYLNSPESPIYSKGQMLYGLNLAKGAIREKGVTLIVEGYMDLLSLHQEGIRNVVASLGTALTSAQVSLLGRYTREVVLIFDADESGKKATQRSLEIFLKEGVSAKVISLPTGFDPDSFIRQEKRAGFERILSTALPVLEYILEQALRRQTTDTVEGKVRVAREVIPALNCLKDPLERDLYVELVASRLGLKESQIRAQLKGRKTAANEGGKTSPRTPRGPAHERLLLQLMLMRSQVIPKVEEAVGKEGFSDPRHQKLAHELMALWETKKKIDVQEFLSRSEDEDLKDLLSELLLAEESVMDEERMLRDGLRKMKLSQIHHEIQLVDEEIRQRSRQAKEDPWGGTGLKELLKRKQRLIVEQKKWLGDSAVGHQPNVGQ